LGWEWVLGRALSREMAVVRFKNPLAIAWEMERRVF
jgi:hypothetical protein